MFPAAKHCSHLIHRQAGPPSPTGKAGNKARQAVITQEITEIVSGSEAL
ncbi:MAG: F0F1 ATP synthase subunit gamma [Clostridia bacterium]|nr:F0F1 ATP synthase subunit gamma [Clostridia bacterium]